MSKLRIEKCITQLGFPIIQRSILYNKRERIFPLFLFPHVLTFPHFLSNQTGSDEKKGEKAYDVVEVGGEGGEEWAERDGRSGHERKRTKARALCLSRVGVGEIDSFHFLVRLSQWILYVSSRRLPSLLQNRGFYLFIYFFLFFMPTLGPNS